jgi:hypothetical protein
MRVDALAYHLAVLAPQQTSVGLVPHPQTSAAWRHHSLLRNLGRGRCCAAMRCPALQPARRVSSLETPSLSAAFTTTQVKQLSNILLYGPLVTSLESMAAASCKKHLHPFYHPEISLYSVESLLSPHRRESGHGRGPMRGARAHTDDQRRAGPGGGENDVSWIIEQSRAESRAKLKKTHQHVSSSFVRTT